MPQPNRINVQAGGGVGFGRVLPTSRFNEQEDPMDQRLRRLAEIESLDREGETSDLQHNAAMMNMAKEYYGIQSEKQLTPAHVALLKAQADYYGQRDEEKPEERTARAMQLELGGLAKAYYGREQSPEYNQGVKNILGKYGYDLSTPAPTGPKPAGEFGPGSGAAPEKPSTVKSSLNPAAMLSSDVSDYTALRNNVGVPLYNAMVSGTNALRGAVGLSPNFEPAQPRPMPSNMPTDYTSWFSQFKKQPQQPQIAVTQ